MKLITAILLSLSTALAADVHEPATELASFQVAEGFAVNLFASEAHGVVKPIQMRFDAKGRLWVVGSSVYPQLEPGQKPDDKVLVLEDRDRDGRCERVTVFANGLMIPTGIELTHDGAYVGHGPELLLLRDTDGDLKADSREVVLRGFGTGDNHQNINSFQWGPSGELWMSQGLHIHSNVETPWGIVRLHQAGIWRLWPNRLKLEGFYGSEHEPQNPWGFVFTDWGEPIVLAGNNSSPIYPVPGLVSRRLDLPPPLLWKSGAGRKVSGGAFVGTAHFPESWQGTLVLGGYLNNAVWVVQIADEGAGFRFEDLPPLIRSTNRSFRPVDVKFGPDGALYVCDWYNPIIGHYQTSFRHPDRDKKHGRIWRVTAKDRPLTQIPDLHAASIPDLLVHLESRDLWTRHFAKRVLVSKPAEEVVPILKKWSPASELGLKEALGVCQSHEAVEPELLARLARARDSGARAYAASVAGLWADRLPDPLGVLRPLIDDAHPRVRLQALIACTHIEKAEALQLAAAITDFPMDRFLDYGWRQAVFALKPYWLPALRSGSLKLPASRLRALAIADGTSDMRDALRELIISALPDSRGNLMEVLAEVGDASDIAHLLELCTTEDTSRVLTAITAAATVRKIKPANASVSLAPFIAAGSPEAFKLAGIWKIETFHKQIERAATDAKFDQKLRRASIQALGDFGSTQVIAQLCADSSPQVQSAAIATLCRLDLPQAVDHAREALPELEDTEAVNEVFTAILQHKNGAAVLAQKLESLPSRISAVGIRVMNASGRRDEALARVLERHGSRRVIDDLGTLVEEVRSRGDAKRGAEIYRRPELGCVACHAIGGEGGVTGPSLSALGTAQPIDFIIGAILEPQKEIKEGYTSTSITTTDEQEFQGYILRETPGEIVIRDTLQNREVRLARSRIKEKRASGSIMPSGLVDSLASEEFRDLVRYLSELGRPQ